MKPYPWKTGTLVALAALFTLLLVLSPGCGGDDGDDNPGGPNGDVPEEWVGIWLQTITLTDCDTQQEYSYTDTLTICPDAEDYEDDTSGVDCDYTWDGDEMSVECTYQDTFGTCLGQNSIQWHGQVSGTSFTAEGTIEVVYTGVECELDTVCTEMVLSGTRIGDAPEPCDPSNDGGGGDGDLAGLSVHISGGETDLAYDVSDLSALVVYDTTNNEYGIQSAVTEAGTTYSLTILFPGEGWPFEFATEPIEGKAFVQFTMVTGLSSAFDLQSVTSGTLTLSEATEEKIVGAFSFSGEMVDLFGSEDPVVFQFESGEFELSVDARTDGIGKAPRALSTEERVLSKIQRDIIRMVREESR
jgi:hypothetical protein